MYSDMDRFDYAKVRVSQEAGELIRDAHEFREPVHVLSDGRVVARFFIPDDAVTVNTEGSAYFDLLDPLQIAQYANINKTFGRNTIEEVVEALVTEIKYHDPNGVLGELFFLNTETAGIETDTYAGHPILDLTLLDPIIVGIGRSISKYSGNLIRADADFDFQDENAWDALNYVLESVGTQAFTDHHGTLYIGHPYFNPVVYGAGHHEQLLDMVDYTIPPSVNTIEKVVVRGSTVVEGGDEIWNLFRDAAAARSEAEAKREGVAGDTVYADAPEIGNPLYLERIAENVLMETVYSDNSGNATIDVLSSWEHAYNDPRYLKCGDLLAIPDHAGICERITAGTFLVSGVQHRISPRHGWQLVVDLGQIITDEITTTSYKTDMASGEHMAEDDSLPSYMEDHLNE